MIHISLGTWQPRGQEAGAGWCWGDFCWLNRVAATRSTNKSPPCKLVIWVLHYSLIYCQVLETIRSEGMLISGAKLRVCLFLFFLNRSCNGFHFHVTRLWKHWDTTERCRLAMYKYTHDLCRSWCKRDLHSCSFICAVHSEVMERSWMEFSRENGRLLKGVFSDGCVDNTITVWANSWNASVQGVPVSPGTHNSLLFSPKFFCFF